MSSKSGIAGSDDGVFIPIPRVHIINGGGNITNQHDYAQFGGLSKNEFKDLEGLNPFVALLRLKKGGRNNTPHPRSIKYDKTRGWVHPSNWIKGSAKTTRDISLRARHTTRGGLIAHDRQTEWDIINYDQFYGDFKPELWFLDTSSQLLTYPVAPVTGSGNEFFKIGTSGQGNRNTFASDSTNAYMSCNSTRYKGAITQYFAFCIGVNDPNADGRVLYGPRSETLRADIFPAIKISYSCPVYADRGRKIRLQWAHF